MKLLLFVLALLTLAGCPSNNTRPVIPAVVTKIVEVPKPLPGWATIPLTKPEPRNGTVGARAESNEARGAVIDMANCHRALIEKISKGEAPDPAVCDK